MPGHLGYDINVIDEPVTSIPPGSQGSQSSTPAPSGGLILPWATDTHYKLGQPVIANGATYLANDAHTSGATFSGDSAHWALLPVSVDLSAEATHTELAAAIAGLSGRFRGTYASLTNGTVIKANDLVTNPSGALVSRIADGTISGSYNPANWTALSAGSSVLYPDGTTTATSVARPGVVYDIRDYGAKLDGVTLEDAAMTNGSAVLTSASAGFTSADVGKRVVVNNALGAGVHLYTTISAYTNATTVTLASGATATISSTAFSYGTNDLAAWTAAIAAAPAGATILCAGRSVIFGTITPTKAVTFSGVGVTPAFGPFTGGFASVVVPIHAPYLRGSVVVQAKASSDVFASATITGEAVNFTDLGIYFAGMFKTTGNGINFTAPALSGAFEQGLAGFYWRNVQVMGHDGTHRAVYLINPYYGTIDHIFSYGGGGYKFDQNHYVNPYGNLVLTHPYHCGLTGALNGFDLTHTGGPLLLNLVQMTRPQAISGGPYLGSAFSGYSLGGYSGASMDASGSQNVHLTAPDMEAGDVTVGNNFYTTGGGIITAHAAGDTAPFMSYYSGNGSRRINRDGSISIDSNEPTGKMLDVLRNNATGARWGITTDGTERLLLPGSLRATGLVGAASIGAGIGTSPPPVLIKGSDVAGRLMFGSGTSPSAGPITTVSFGRTMAAAPAVQITPENAATQALGLHAVATTTGFTVTAANAPTASQSVSTYAFSYAVVEAGGAPVIPVVFDNFNKTDSASSIGSPQIGSAPTVRAGTWGIASNTAYLAVASDPNNWNTIVWDAGLADCTIQVKMATQSGNAGICFRNNGVNSTFAVNANYLWLRSAAGTFTNLATLSPGYASGDTVSVVLLGSSIKVYVNGVLSASVTDTTNQAITNHGLVASVTGARFDNFQVTA